MTNPNQAQYPPRDFNPTTLVQFRVFIEPRLLDDGDRLIINGNLPELSNWQEGIELSPSEDLSSWSIAIELPFSATASNPTGLFRYRYEIVPQNGHTIPEGNLDRSEQVLRTHYYHFFRGNFRIQRFRGWIAPLSKDLFQYFCRQIISEDRTNFDQIFQKFSNLLICFPEAHRSQIESMFEESIQEILPHPLMLSIVYLGFIGAFGLTSDEQLSGYHSYSDVGGVQIGNPTYYYPYGAVSKRRPPKPTAWVYYCALELDVVTLYRMDWMATFGPKFRWISRGIMEAIERLSEHDSYDWLKIIPLASKCNFCPKIAEKMKSKKCSSYKGLEDKFVMTTKNIFQLVQDQFDFIGTDEVGLGSENITFNLIQTWFNSIVLHAPSLTILSHLCCEISASRFGHTQYFRLLQTDLICSFKSRIEEEELTFGDLEILETVLVEQSFLLCPDIATALFKNSSCEPMVNRLVHIVNLCLKGKEWDVSGGELFKSNENKLSGLDGVWHDLNVAAKEFLCRKHNTEPLESPVEAKKEHLAGWAFPYWGTHQYEKRTKNVSEEEVRRRYKHHMKLALVDIDFLLQVPFFASNPNGLLFEFGRCWFSKAGNVQHSLNSFSALSFIVSEDTWFQSLHPHLTGYLENAFFKQFKDIANDETIIKSALLEVTRNFSPSSPFAHHLLYKLALYLTCPESSSDEASNLTVPSLRSIFQNSFLWIELLLWTSPCTIGSLLMELLGSVGEVLQKTTKLVEQSSCNLHDMHVLMDHMEIFFMMVEKYHISCPWNSSIDMLPLVETLNEFDLSLEHLQTYVSFYCTCGVKIDGNSLRQKMEYLRHRYDMIQLSELPLMFSDVPIMPFVSWLYHLRGSELFLQSWHLIGEEIKLSILLGRTQNRIKSSVPLLPEVNENGRTFAERVAVLEALMLQQSRQDIDLRNSTFEAIEAVELSQEIVVQSFIPAIQTQWSTFAKETFNGQIALSKLDNTFAHLIYQEGIAQELKLLLSTSDVFPEDLHSPLLETTLASIKDYFFLRKLYIWLPGLLRLHEQLKSLHCNFDEDPFCEILKKTQAKIKEAGAELTLASIPDLIAHIRVVLSQYSVAQLDFCCTLSSSPELIQWLLSQNSTEEFNKLLQVVRPCTDDPRMLSAIASLVHVRTILIQVFYIHPPYDSFENFFFSVLNHVDFATSADVSSLWHLENIISSFESLMNVILRQTRSPGIKACYDLLELSKFGIFVLQASSSHSNVLYVEFLENRDQSTKIISRESIDYLYDLRSKLLMTEIPAELDVQFQAAAMTEEFIQQLQILSEMSDVIMNLFVTGHVDYQEGFEMKTKFLLGGVLTLKEILKHLQAEFIRWENEVKTARLNFYYLNFFTVQELLRMRHLLSVATLQADEVSGPPSPIKFVTLDPESEDIVFQMEQMGFSRDWSIASIKRSEKNLESAVDFCLCHSHMMDRYVADDSFEIPADSEVKSQLSVSNVNPIDEIHGLLHLVSSTIDVVETYKLMELWKAALPIDSHSVLSTFGQVFAVLFETHCNGNFRRISFPDDGIKTDLLIVLDDEKERKLPLFIACTEGPHLVIETVLSVYIRRGRLPEPSEVLFCTNETSLEDLHILLLRFCFARKISRGDWIFCVADLHNLSYTLQCRMVERLRLLFLEHGSSQAATLLLVSGRPKQVALHTLSSHVINLLPLELGQLRKSCGEAFHTHFGHTECVASTVNGGGKSHYILSEVANRQLCGEHILYQKISLRESTNFSDLVELMSSSSNLRGNRSPNVPKIAYHFDIAHIIPSNANTMLFQLLFIGALKCPISHRVIYRSRVDMYMIEVPNSPNNKTIHALRVCNLLPYILLTVSAEGLQTIRPILQSFPTSCYPKVGTAVILEQYIEMEYVCKWLRAINSGKIHYGGSAYDSFYSPWTDVPITKEECFELLRIKCCQGRSTAYPSWSLFHSFIVFMNMQFSALEKYPLLQNEVLSYVQGLENFKHVFVELLVETSLDFSLRSVPQLERIGPLIGSPFLVDEERENFGGELLSELPALSTLAGLDLQPSEEVVHRFQKMISWEESEHPIVLFKMDFYGDVHGIDLLSLNPNFLDRYIQGDLKRSLEENHFEFNRDWKNISNEIGVQLIRSVEGLECHRGGLDFLETGYVMTVDNILKMLIIQLRLRFNLPVVIMGETGCGKSTLIRNMCAILGIPLHILNIHGGMEDRDVIQWMMQKVTIANKIIDPSQRIIVFLDEINTCNCMDLFKEIVCDRSVNGTILPQNLKIIAACNPYRLRTGLARGKEIAGLSYFNSTLSSPENVGTGIKDPLENLIYRVHPLPESIIDHVFDFGSLSVETEGLYVRAMLREKLSTFYSGHIALSNGVEYDSLNQFGEFVEVFSELICDAQECIRNLSNGERSSVSLRDVSRCVQIFLWFGKHFSNSRGSREGWGLTDFYTMKPCAHKGIRRALILSLAYCYYARLPREERKILIKSLSNKWRSFQISCPSAYNHFRATTPLHQLTKPKCRWLHLDHNSFISILEETQRDFVSMMNVGDGIVLNEALCENLFMILCSILNQIPIFVIGKPGSSKSLAMGLIQSNLNGEASENEFLRALPAAEVFSYQCSPLSTTLGIEQVFESARRYKREASNTIVVILLDEVGLAEQSPHLPLKVLHKMFDEADENETVVGISNWSLDPAKMNRAVHLYRPAPTEDDLSNTAEGMVQSAHLKGYLTELAKAYNEIYQSQRHPDFWGLRDFYSTVKAINYLISQRKEVSGNDISLDSSILLHALLRNFGGRPLELDEIIKCFFARLGLPTPTPWNNYSTEELIISNLRETDARHLMLLTTNNAALNLLLDRSVLHQDRTEIIFGSDFPLDQTDLQVCMNIQRVKLCMAEGITTVLVNCESLYESLYDLLNQHYVSYGGQIYVRLAFGSYTRLCPMHKNFRIIVIIEKEEAYSRLAPPLLNRFEKQVLERCNVLLPFQLQMLYRLQGFCRAYVSVWETKSMNSWFAYRASFAGYHSDMLSSMILAVHDPSRSNQDILENQMDTLFYECVTRLLWICTPEATFRLSTLKGGYYAKAIMEEFGVDCSRQYFLDQCHSSVRSFIDRVLYKWCDRLGAQVTLLTFSPLAQCVFSEFEMGGNKVTHVVLHELGQERELRQMVSDFFKIAEDHSLLLLQCDPLATSKRRIEQTKFLIEHYRAKRLKQLEMTIGHLTSNDGAEYKDSGQVMIKSCLNIHVVLLIHLPRIESSEALFNIDFDTRWRVAFLDSLHSDVVNGLPEIESMVGRSLTDIFIGLNTQKVLITTFRTALSKMVCLFNRSNDDVRKKIFYVTKCLSHPLFIEMVRDLLIELIDKKYYKNTFELTNLDFNSKELHLCGSFQGTLHRKILETISVLFAVILSQIDRNDNLHLLLEERVSHIWIYLFKQFINGATLLTKIKWRKSGLVTEEVVELKSDSYPESAPFTNRFPFSFFLVPMIESMRSLAEDQDENFLQRQLSSMGFQYETFESLDRPLISDFVYDFTCMKCREIPTLSRSRQADLVIHLFENINCAQECDDNSNRLTLISQILFRFWKFERALELYFDVMACNIIPLEVFVSFLLNNKFTFSSSMHFGLLQLLLAYICPIHNFVDFRNAQKALMQFAHSVRGSYHALTDLLEDESMRFLSLISWKRLEFLQVFLRDICIPLNLPVNFLETIASQFVDPYMATLTVFQKLLQLLYLLSIGNYSDNDVICPLKLEKLCDTVFANERSSIQEMFLSVESTSSATNLQAPELTLIPNVYFKRRINQLLNFLEYFVFDILFSHLYRDKLDDDLIEGLICFISGGVISHPEQCQTLIPDEKFIERVLRELFKRGNSLDQLNASLELHLGECALKYSYLDTPFSFAYVIVRQEYFEKLEILKVTPTLNLEVTDVKNFCALLDSVAHIRSILEKYANLLDIQSRTQTLNTELQSTLEIYTRLVSSILEDGYFQPSIRLLRMFFLKLLYRNRGLSYVRDRLLQSPLRDTLWISQWRSSHDVGFAKFLGSSRLPKLNPFVSYPFFSVVHDALCSFILSGDIVRFDARVLEMKEKLSLGDLCGGLLLAGFQELGMLCLLPSESVDNFRDKVSLLEQWIHSPSGILSSVSESYKHLIITLGFGNLSSLRVICPTITLNDTSPTEAILRIRFTVHLAAVAMMFESRSHPLKYIHSLIFCPILLQDSYFPTMPQDLTKMAQNVIGGRWYACPNNHPFYVDLCGRPTLIQYCAECGAQIGGENHNLLESNKDLGNVGAAYYQTTVLPDNSEKNYCGRRWEKENEDRFFTARLLNASSLRLLRVIINTGLHCGASVFGPSWCERAQPFMNRNYNCPDNLSDFFVENVTNDWALLRSFLSISMDQVALLLHQVLSNCLVEADTKVFSLEHGGEKPFTSLTHPSVRDYWEEFMDKQYILPFTACSKEELFEKLTVVDQMYGGHEQNGVVGVFANELQDRLHLQDVDGNQRRYSAPGLWRLSVSFSYDNFLNTLGQQQNAKDKYPLLCLMTSEDPCQLKVLRYIPAVIEWFRLLRVNFSGTIDREDARSRSISTVLDDLCRGSILVREKLLALFHSYCLAWNNSWKNVLRFGCVKFSSDYNSLHMDLDTPLSFSLPNEHDEGNCPLSLIHYLIEKHNTFAQRVDEYLLFRSRDKNLTDNFRVVERVPLISSRFLTSAHTIRCDMALDLWPLLGKYSVVLDDRSGFLGYDFAKAENIIVERFLSDIPVIDLEIPGFRFSHEQYLHGGMTVLRQKIKQQLIPQDFVRLIQREISSPILAHKFLDHVEQVVSFISSTGGKMAPFDENVGNMSLGEYLKTVLLIDEVNELISRVSHQIPLNCLEALWNILIEITKSNIFTEIHEVYKAPLQPRSKLALQEAMILPTFNAQRILAIMKSFMLENLQEQTITPSVSIHTCMINLEVEGVLLGDLEWFVVSFPEVVTMGEIVECFEFIKEGQIIQ